MIIEENKAITIRYLFTWGLSSIIGTWLLLGSLAGPLLKDFRSKYDFL